MSAIKEHYHNEIEQGMRGDKGVRSLFERFLRPRPHKKRLHAKLRK